MLRFLRHVGELRALGGRGGRRGGEGVTFKVFSTPESLEFRSSVRGRVQQTCSSFDALYL